MFPPASGAASRPVYNYLTYSVKLLVEKLMTWNGLKSRINISPMKRSHISDGDGR